MTAHPWALVAPWYRWPAQGVPGARTGRDTRPVLQKYAGPRFVDDFLQEPQRSLVFGAEDRWAYPVELPPAGAGRRRRVADHRMVTTATKKLHLPVHGRFYLVVCSLHCDTTGFPAAGGDDVARAGFVVRRRAVRPADPSVGLPGDVLQRLATARTALADVPVPAGAGPLELTAGPAWSVHRETRVAAALELRAAQIELAEWATTAGVSFDLEGWHASGDDGFGWWGPVDEEPDELGDEVVHPLLPVRAPQAPGHDAVGTCLFFGLVPTGSPDLTPAGAPRFDDEHLYEIRCFVEREGCCPPGPLTWSAATDRYLLASSHDVTGTGLRPVTVTLPSLPTALAEAAAAPSGRAGVRFRSPAGALPMGDAGDGGLVEEARTTSLPVPLLMMVATFVVNVFVRAMVHTRGLWGLVPATSIFPATSAASAALDAELAALDGLDIDADLPSAQQDALDALLRDELAESLGPYLASGMLATLSTGTLVELRGRLQVDLEDPDGGIDLRADLLYEPHVDREQVALR